MFPDPCIVCTKPAGKDSFVCVRCASDLNYIGSNFACKTCLSPVLPGEYRCPSCMINPPKYKRLIAAVSYSGEVQKTLRLFKFYDQPQYAASFSRLLCDVLYRENCIDFDAIVPVPLSKKRLKERGYNQSELIANGIGAQLHIPCIPDALKKVKETARQSDLSFKERAKNIRGAFSLHKPDEVRGKKVLLIDDIFTTGATMREAALTLSKSTNQIIAATVALTELNHTSFSNTRTSKDE